jgi:hypothetical protein
MTSFRATAYVLALGAALTLGAMTPAGAQELGLAVGPGFGSHEDMESTFVVTAWLRSESRPVELRVGWAGGSDERVGLACSPLTDEACAEEPLDIEASLSTARLGYVMTLREGPGLEVFFVPAVGAGYAQTTRDGKETGKSITAFTAVFGADLGIEARFRPADSLPIFLSAGAHAQGWFNPFPVELESFKPFEDPFSQVQLELGLVWTP